MIYTQLLLYHFSFYINTTVTSLQAFRIAFLSVSVCYGCNFMLKAVKSLKCYNKQHFRGGGYAKLLACYKKVCRRSVSTSIFSRSQGGAYIISLFDQSNLLCILFDRLSVSLVRSSIYWRLRPILWRCLELVNKPQVLLYKELLRGFIRLEFSKT